MEKSKREHLFELCGGDNITPHQHAQINDPETRHVALSDLAKVTRRFLETKAWRDDQHDLELSLLALRGPDLLSAIEEEAFQSTRSFVEDSETSLGDVTASLLTIYRRSSQEEGSGSARQGCAMTLAVHCLYWAMATGLRPWEELNDIQEFEEKLAERMGASGRDQESAGQLTRLRKDVISTESMNYIKGEFIKQYPGAQFIFINQAEKNPAEPHQEILPAELEQMEKAALGYLSRYRQADTLMKVVQGWLAKEEPERALTAARFIRRHDMLGDALSRVLSSRLRLGKAMDASHLEELEQATNKIPSQTNRARFGGSGQDRSKHLTRLGWFQNRNGEKRQSSETMLQALAGLTRHEESAYDQVEFALLAAPMTPEPGVFIQYAVKKIGETWNWGDQGRMIKWFHDCCLQFNHVDPLETISDELEPELSRLEFAESESQERSSQALLHEPRPCLFLFTYLARALIHHQRIDKATGLLERVEALENLMQNENRGEFQELICQAYAEAGYYKNAAAAAEKNPNPLYRCRSLMDLLGLIPSAMTEDENAERLGLMNIKQDLEDDLAVQIPLLKASQRAEILMQKKILDYPSISVNELLASLAEGNNQPNAIINTTWRLLKARAPRFREWIDRGRECLTSKLAELESVGSLNPTDYRKMCEVYLCSGKWGNVSRLVGEMPKDHQQTIQLMNHPLMATELAGKYPGYKELYGWVSSSGVGELTHRWILRQWRRQTAMASPRPLEPIRQSFADPDIWSNGWAVRCHLLAVLREKGWEEYRQLAASLSAKMDFPNK